MIAIVCIDDNFGMMFNNRRQSRDITIVQKITEIAKNSKIWVNKYSYPLFEEVNNSNVNVDEAFLSEAASGEYCFIENKALKPYEKWIEKLIVFRWNRDYPTDKKFDIDLSLWSLQESTEFVGNSHKKLTMEVYTK